MSGVLICQVSLVEKWKIMLLLEQSPYMIDAGNLFTRTSYASARLDMDSSGLDLSSTVGLVVRVKGDKQTYAVVLTLGKLINSKRWCL